MFSSFPKSDIQIIAPNGELRSSTKAIVDSKLATIPDPSVTVLAGDEIRRKLPNGVEEAFDVVDPVFYDKTFGIPAHYQVKIKRKGTFPAGTGGHYTFNLSGHNSRVNISSNDSSHNVVGNNAVFGDLRTSIKSGVSDEALQSRLLSLITDMEAAKDSKEKFTSVYASFMAAAANHMTLIAPFLPALATFMV